MSELEDEALIRIKPTRTRQEYCWTCTPSTILYCIERFDLPHCTYLDADTYFFSDPDILINEAGNEYPVIITDHRYAEEYDNSVLSGKYCVQFMYFKNSPAGLEVLKDWRNDCIEWCYARCEDGKFGDQKYLDDWVSRYPETIWELQNIGGGVAPWNVKKYDIYLDDSKLMIRDIRNQETRRLVFYHFHGFRFNDNGEWYFDGDYQISDFVLSHIYKSYLTRLYRLSEEFPEIAAITDLPGIFSRFKSDYFEMAILSRLNITDRLLFRSSYIKKNECFVLMDGLSSVEKKRLTLLSIEALCNLLNSDIGYIQQYHNARYYKDALRAREKRTKKALILDILLDLPFFQWIPRLLGHENYKVL
ncbi:hypothetical protein [Leptospira yasudae]|uniref:Glycosyl transferase n=1 Tax=Leptospira yasudae TaxID=2202201 RepID=A0A6N4QJR9_9LEPT|nr:hypothetical protein [Leptospira yasudae]TGL82574.1 hypothetical protein EHQ72_04340 [Leptospira yasudae]TGL89524.1 hypothetical protein EHQ83_01040 [Leptospira yasudae]